MTTTLQQHKDILLNSCETLSDMVMHVNVVCGYDDSYCDSYQRLQKGEDDELIEAILACDEAHEFPSWLAHADKEPPRGDQKIYSADGENLMIWHAWHRYYDLMTYEHYIECHSL